MMDKCADSIIADYPTRFVSHGGAQAVSNLQRHPAMILSVIAIRSELANWLQAPVPVTSWLPMRYSTRILGIIGVLMITKWV